MAWVVLACVLVCVVSVLFSQFFGKWRRLMRARRHLEKLPSFMQLPLIGNLHLFLGDGEYFLYIYQIISKMMETYMSPFAVWLGPVPFVVVSVPEDVKTIALAYGDKAKQYQFTHNSYGDGLITCPWSKYKHTSKKLSASFNSAVVAGYQPIFNVHAQELVEQLKTEAGKAPFDVFRKYVDWMSMQTIYRKTIGLFNATFGVPHTHKHGVTKSYLRAFSKLLMYYCKRALYVHQYFDFVYKLSADSKIVSKLENIINGDAEKMINHRKAERENGIISDNDDSTLESEGMKEDFKPYIDILLDLSKTDPVFDQRQILSELNTIISAGHDTLANTLTMIFLMIGSHPQVQETLYKEINDVFGDSKRPVTKEDLSRMPYCEAVVNETLRLYPAVPVCFRQADRDLELKQCTIPEGTVCGINIWGCGRSKYTWGDDAEVFRPERWLEKANFNPFFIPFSYGRRTCIGRRYTMAMLKTTLTHCARELVFHADTRGLRLRVYVTLQPFRGQEIQVQLRSSALLL